MGRIDSRAGTSNSDEALAPRTLGWMFVKTVVFCACVCVVVLSMAEFISP